MKYSGLTWSWWPEHHAESQLFLQDWLNKHHIQITDNSAIDHHNLITFHQTWKDPRGNCVVQAMRKWEEQIPFPLATLLSSTLLTKQHNSSCLSLFSTNSASMENPHMVSTLIRFSSNWYRVLAQISMISWLAWKGVKGCVSFPSNRLR